MTSKLRVLDLFSGIGGFSFGLGLTGGGWEEFSGTWPRSGMTRSGIVYRLAPLVPLTAATASGLWRTPVARDATRGMKGRRLYLPIQVAHCRLWPTPQAKDSARDISIKRDRLSDAVGSSVTTGRLNPLWVEWLMGFPIG